MHPTIVHFAAACFVIAVILYFSDKDIIEFFVLLILAWVGIAFLLFYFFP